MSPARKVHITTHAIERYRQRVADLPDHQIVANLDTPAVRAAASFETECHVRLPTGQRIVVNNGAVITVTPRPILKRCKTGKPRQ